VRAKHSSKSQENPVLVREILGKTDREYLERLLLPVSQGLETKKSRNREEENRLRTEWELIIAKNGQLRRFKTNPTVFKRLLFGN
jgi:hypothetical protein